MSFLSKIKSINHRGDLYEKKHSRRNKDSFYEGFKDYINTRIQAAKPEWIPATVLLKEIQDKGYKGKISILREYIKQFKEVNTPKPISRIHDGRQ